MTAIAKNLTTHVALVLDRSVSMRDLKDKTIEIADKLVAFLAEQSKKMGQEWRVSVYTFGDEVDCHIWDMDVLRLPSMKEHYKIKGSTALVDAVTLALDDGDKITEHRGDHSFLIYVITDGEENVSRLSYRGTFGYASKDEKVRHMRARIAAADKQGNRTLSVLVPDAKGVREAREFGFSIGNIKLWDASSEQGMEEAAKAIEESATEYMRTRASGGRSTTSLFVGGNVNAQAVKAANLKPIPHKDRKITVVVKTEDSFEKVVKPANSRRKVPEMGWFVKIEDYVKRVNKGEYPLGDAFYELVKSETIQGDKEIAVVDVDTNQVYVGDGARQLLGLPDTRCRVKPNLNPEYKIFVQSNSLNRHLPHGSSVMVLKR